MSSGGTGLYATMATRTSDRFPQEYLEQTLADLKVGEHSVVPATVLAVDGNVRCWLRPEVVCETDRTALNTTTPYIMDWRESKGYAMRLHTCKPIAGDLRRFRSLRRSRPFSCPCRRRCRCRVEALTVLKGRSCKRRRRRQSSVFSFTLCFI